MMKNLLLLSLFLAAFPGDGFAQAIVCEFDSSTVNPIISTFIGGLAAMAFTLGVRGGQAL